MTSLTPSLLAPSQATFTSACENARSNLQSALDLIAVHREAPVRGRQPRTALNPAIAVAGVAAWERFVADLLGAVTVDPMSPTQAAYAPGLYAEERGLVRPDVANARLQKAGYLTKGNGKLPDRWVADVPTAWTGTRPRNWVATDDPEAKQARVDYIEAAIVVRNAGAHSGQQALQRVVEQIQQKQQRQLPVLMSDAASGTTIQHGYAVGIVALTVQVIDSTIAAINHDQSWTDNRLPDNWFQRGPQTIARYSGIDFWQHKLPRAS